MRIYGILALLALLVVAACSPNTAAPATETESNQATAAATATPVPATDEPMEEPTHEPMGESMDEATDEPMDKATDEPMEEPTEMVDEAAPETADEMVAYSGPEWTQVELTNAHTGETFTLADFAGKTVYVEPMATWCGNCKSQQRTLIEVVDDLGADDYVFISLSVETSIAGESLAGYADANGFNWLFTVTTPEMLQALTADYGRSVNVPPSTPHFFLAPDGTASQLYTGMHNANELTEQITAVSQG
jgi:thiol-disulfide isomerase/thioredoxin